MNVNMLPSLIFTVFAFLYSAYLSYIQVDANKRKEIMSRHKANSFNYELYDRVYSRPFLVVWLLLTLWFVFNFLFEALRPSHEHVPTLILAVSLLASVLLSSLALHLWSVSFSRKGHK